MQEITIEPCDLWDYLINQDSKGQLNGVLYEIAKNEEYGVTVYVSKDSSNRYYITVEADDIEIFSDVLYDKADSEAVCKKVYDEYLTGAVIDCFIESGNLGHEDEIEEREEELTSCIATFILDITGACTYEDLDGFDDDAFNEIVDDCKEHFLEYMARKHGLPIYRPMVLEDENGEDFFEEYPYECMEFEDENNPIYKS